MSSTWGGSCTGSTSSDSSDLFGGPSTSMIMSCPIYSTPNYTVSGTGTATASSDGVTPSFGIVVTWKF